MKRLDIATDALCDGCGNEHRACTCARPATAPAPLDGAVAREVSAAVEAERRRCLAIIDRELRESVDGFARERDAVWGSRPVPDATTALMNLADRTATMASTLVGATRRLVMGRGVSPDTRDAVTGAWAALAKAGDDAMRALARPTGGTR